MKHFIGVAVLVALALVARFCLFSRFSLDVVFYANYYVMPPLRIIGFWLLMGIAAVWQSFRRTFLNPDRFHTYSVNLIFENAEFRYLLDRLLGCSWVGMLFIYVVPDREPRHLCTREGLLRWNELLNRSLPFPGCEFQSRDTESRTQDFAYQSLSSNLYFALAWIGLHAARYPP